MTKILVTSEGDWGDEFDLEGFALFRSKEDWEHYKEGIPDKPVERYYGSNEFVTFESREDYLNYLTVKEITDEEFDTICRLFGLKFSSYTTCITYGLFIANSENY